MTALVIRGDARHLPLPDETVDLIVTSPPYFALRSYSDVLDCLECYEMRLNGRDPRQAWPDYAAHVRDVHERRHYPGQIGSEPTPQEFLEALWECTAEMMRVLKPSGSIFINLGDKYAHAGGQPKNLSPAQLSGGWGTGGKAVNNTRVADTWGFPSKSLILLPERYRIGCVDQLGLTARAVIVWDKPNGLPESVTDRVRRSHEDWVHLTKQPRYYSAVDQIREPQDRFVSGGRPPSRKEAPESFQQAGFAHKRGGFNDYRSANGVNYNSLGKLPGSVWTIPTEPLTVPDHLGIDHFAAYPCEWPKRLIRGWSPPGICTECGEGQRPVATRAETSRVTGNQRDMRRSRAGDATWSFAERTTTTTTILGYVCACTPHTDHPGTGERYFTGGGNRGLNTTSGTRIPHVARGDDGHVPKVGPWREYHFDQWTPAPTRPAIVLDPFSGTGTTALVASALGRIGIGVDLSHDYGRLAQWRTTDRAQIAKVLEVPKPPVIPQTQLGFDFEDDITQDPPSKKGGGIYYATQRGPRECHVCGYGVQYANRPTCEKCGATREDAS